MATPERKCPLAGPSATRWHFDFPHPDPRLTPSARDELAGRVVEIAQGRGGAPFHRSRNSATYLVALAATGSRLEVFIKLSDAARGLDAIKAIFRGSEAKRVLRVTSALERAGFAVAPILMCGWDAGGRAALVTERVNATPLVRWFDHRGGAMAVRQKWALLRALGAEVARLHLSGFIHGDLTPYNVFVDGTEPPRFIFIDHARTRRAFPIGRTRRQMRNFVQLGHFELQGLTRSDRMRMFKSYVAAIWPGRRRRLARRVAAMLEARIARERAARSRPNSR